MRATARRLLWPILGVALAVFLVAVVFPTRTYFQQRDDIASAEEKLAVLTAENAKLDARVEQLHTDAEIERLAREQYNLVRPGEEAYAILPGPTDPEPSEVPSTPPSGADVRTAEATPSLVDEALDVLTFWD
ncbi:MAG TPA: septum formation initiator family protein [Acidimicrobiales bacterium]|nr:septum formation initiator family protein [Acidimicrobiales bacterium]